MLAEKQVGAVNDHFTYSEKLAFLREACIDPRLVRTDLAVLAVMLGYANSATRECFPSVATLVRDSGVPRTTTIRAIQRLLDTGWVQANKRHGAVTAYRLTGATSGTGSADGTGTTWNATGTTQVLRTGPADGTEAVPPTGHEKEEKKNRKKQQGARGKEAVPVDLPAWLPADAWQSWKDHRKQVGRKFTEQGQRLAIRKLELLIAEGHDPRKLIELAIESGWSSFNARDSTKAISAPSSAAGLLPRDARSDAERDAANDKELARFGIGSAQ